MSPARNRHHDNCTTQHKYSLNCATCGHLPFIVKQRHDGPALGVGCPIHQTGHHRRENNCRASFVRRKWRFPRPTRKIGIFFFFQMVVVNFRFWFIRSALLHVFCYLDLGFLICSSAMLFRWPIYDLRVKVGDFFTGCNLSNGRANDVDFQCRLRIRIL